jgi:primosomal protein N' (replication factor Y)
MLDRFQQRFSVPIVALHSGLKPSERLRNWLWARAGLAPIIIGTRSAVWTPLARPGIFIVDEEHDPSYKQQDAFNYSARDVAVIRAHRAQVPVILGSATPSLDSLYNVQQQRYHHFLLPERAGDALHPHFHLVDMRQQNQKSNLSQPLQMAIQQCLSDQQQALIFINRRGYAPTLICYQCTWIATCQHCDSHLVYHESCQKLICHHCGDSRPVDSCCPHCGHAKLYPLGQGTQRIEKQLEKLFPTARIARMDSDTTRRRHALPSLLAAIHAREVDILIGTQMLAKGHHFPEITLVGVINIDASLFGADFRSSERAAQMLIQVAGRAGRAEKPGKVIIQTYYPHHPLLLHLIKEGYSAFAKIALEERRQAQFPPYCYFALLRAEAKTPNSAIEFLQHAKDHAQRSTVVEAITFWGPVPAPLERRAQFYRAQLLLQASHRSTLHQFLNQWLPSLQSIATHKIRYSLDIDPQDLS